MTHEEFQRAMAVALDRFLDSPKFQRVLRRALRLVILEQRAQARVESATIFLRECEERGVKVWLGDDDRVRVSGNLAADLRAILTMYRDEIEWRLRHIKDMERENERHRLQQFTRRNGDGDQRGARGGADARP